MIGSVVSSHLILFLILRVDMIGSVVSYHNKISLI